jgi:G3E family GTPase
VTYFLPPEAGERIPVSLITGFLGSGKTTLLNCLLRHPQMKNTAVVINEFGEVPLDQLFVQQTTGEVTILANGCLCCDVQGDLEGVIGTLFGRRKRGDVPAFDRMLIETTGVADPAPIMQMLLNQPLVVDNFRLDAVVTTVDALHAARQLREHREAVDQVALADRLVLTKTDLVSPAEAQAVRGQLRDMNPSALIRDSAADIAPSDLFGAGHGAHNVATPVHDHLHGIETFSLALEQPVDWRQFSRWLNRLKIDHADQLLRVKGIVYVAGEDEPVAIHGVHHVFHPPMKLARSTTDRRSRLVFITRGGLSRDAVAPQLEATLA